MEKIPTAEDFLQDHLQISHFYDDNINQMVCYSSDVQQAMIEFARLHVEASLKEASENVKLTEYGCRDGRITEENAPNPYFVPSYFGEDNEIEINKDSILNAYPLENIK